MKRVQSPGSVAVGTLLSGASLLADDLRKLTSLSGTYFPFASLTSCCQMASKTPDVRTLEWWPEMGLPGAQRGLDTFAKSHSKVGSKAATRMKNLTAMEVDNRMLA